MIAGGDFNFMKNPTEIGAKAYIVVSSKITADIRSWASIIARIYKNIF